MPKIPDAESSILPSQGDLFEIPEDVTYLNCAAISPQLRAVSEAGFGSVKSKAEPWNISSDDWFTAPKILREIAANLINAQPESIAFIPAVSYGIAVAARNVRVEPEQSIVLLDEEFPSNYYAWKNLARERQANLVMAYRSEGETWTQAVLDTIDDKTAVVSVPNCHWTDGSLIDLVKVGEKARQVGAALVVDASQSLGAYPLDIAKIQPDFLVSVVYKWLLGPFALGIMYVAPKWQKEGKPIENSWLNRAGSEDFSRLVAYTDEYQLGARRFDMGEFSNFVLVPMTTAALRQIGEWQIGKIQKTLSVLTGSIAEKAIKLGCTVSPPEERVGHLIGIRLPAGVPAGLSERLAEEKIYVSIRGNAIRIAPHLYNEEKDIEKLFTLLQKLI